MLGIIAGRGDLPRALAETRAARGLPYLVIALDGFAGDWVRDHPHAAAPLSAPSRILAALRGAGAGTVVAAGGVERPSLRALTDPVALRWLPRLAPALARGDDALLRTVRFLLENEGLTLIGAHEILDTTRPEGHLAGPAPSPADLADAARGEAILAALGALDVGQGCVVASGRVLGIETVQGTDAMLDFVAATRGAGQGAEGGVLIKRAKPGQDRALDLPAVGPRTVAAARRAG
ncbi:MAG: LpxI family protein, partial [Hasllibacter sp.]